MFTQLLALTRALMIIIVRNAQALRMSLLMPAVLMVLLGFVSQTTPPTVGVITNGPLGSLTVALHHTSFRIKNFRTLNSALGALQNGHVDAVLDSVPKSKADAHIKIWDTSATRSQAVAVENFTYRFVLSEQNAALHQSSPIAIKTIASSQGSQSYTAYLVPGLIGMVIMNTSLFFMANLVTRWRTNYVLKRLKATSLTSVVIITSIIISQTVVGLFGVATLLGGAVK